MERSRPVAEVKKSIEDISNMVDNVGEDAKYLKDLIAKIKKDVELASNNCKLYYYFTSSTCKKFDDIDIAVSQYHDDYILAHIADINKYGLYTPENYQRFVASFTNNTLIDNPKPEFNPAQIILTNKKQKMVFICSHNKSETIKKLAAEFFKCELISTGRDNNIEITVTTGLYSNFNDVSAAFQLFYNYVYKNNSDDASNIRLPQIHLVGDHMYIRKNILIENDSTLETITKILANSSSNVTVIIGNNNTINITNNVKISKKQETINSAIDWIRENPPQKNEKSSDYYTRYADFNPNGMPSNTFGPLVTGAGYEKRQDKNGRRIYV